jgi:hypothetical protein
VDSGDKMRFSLKTSKRKYGLEIGRTARSVIVNVQPRAQMYNQSMTGELHFYQQSLAHVFLTLELF